MALRFDDRVAIVTGAGNGIGKCYALELAKRGAKVVVNDPGVSTSGEGSDNAPAQQVVDEIRSAGGVAVPNFDSVEFGDRIVQTAIDNFGRIDILINNAGILRDRSMKKATIEEWDLIFKVHLHGVYSTIRAAWPHMRQAGYGRILNTSSPSGIYGNFGQANYGAAKMAILGLTRSLAVEGQKNNILVNCIAPTALSRMTKDLFPPEYHDVFTPEKIVPTVLYMCHESNENTSELIELGGGFQAKLRYQRAHGLVLSGDFTAEDVAKGWEATGDFSKPQYPTTMVETMTFTMQRIAEANEAKPKL